MRHERVTICAIAAGIVLTLPLPAAPQQTGKLVRIGCLSAASEAAAGHFFDAFRQRLRELRYVEGRDVVLEYRWANGRYERLPALAAELVREPVDLIFATSAPAATAARDATTTVPIVMRITGDPVETGLATSMARPGGNITGVADFVSPIGKHIEFLKQVAPRLKRVAVLQNPAGNQTEVQLRQSREVAGALGLELYAVGARTPQELDAAFASIVADPSGALAVLADGLFTIHRARIAEFALKARLPAIYARREFAEAGGLMSYALEPQRTVSARRQSGRQDPQGRQAGRPAGRAARPVRAGPQREDCSRARAHDPPVTVAPRRSRPRLTSRKPLEERGVLEARHLTAPSH